MSNSLTAQVVQACSSGKINELTNIISPLSFEERNEIVKFDNYACFHLGAAHGHRDVVDFIFKYIKSVSDASPEFVATRNRNMKLITHLHTAGFRPTII